MDFKNEIVLNGKFGPNSLALTDNVEQSFRTGFELTLLYKLNKNFSFVNNSSFNYSRIIEQKEKFSPILTPPIIVNQEIIYTKNKFECNVSSRYQHKSFIDFANSAIVKSYLILNSKIAYNFNKVQLAFFVNNITNKKYFNHGYVDFGPKYFVQAPINFFTSIQFKLK
jgi:iron complex outermembrane receptor protein